MAPFSRNTSRKEIRIIDEGVELGQPGHDDGGKAAAAGGGRWRWCGLTPATARKPARPQMRAGDGHGADDDASAR